ncbi:MAG: hypothetical protein QOJ54_1417 [Aliidongia sp.]|nr:hypothetical protein [Aliidongia sp.]
MPSIHDYETVDQDTDHAARQLLNLANAFCLLIGEKATRSALLTVYLNMSLQITDVPHVEKSLRFAIDNLPLMKQMQDMSMPSQYRQAGSA